MFVYMIVSNDIMTFVINFEVHSKIRCITPLATKVHVILRSFVVLT